MYIIHGDSVQTLFHKIGVITLQNGALSVAITTRSPEPLSVPQGTSQTEWTNTYPVPISDFSEQAVADWLVSEDGIFAGGVIVSDEDFEVAGQKVFLRRKTKNKRDAVEHGGITVGELGDFDSDPDSQRKVNGAVTMALIAAQNSQTFELTWRLSDDTTVVLDAPAMVSVGVAFGQHVAACQARKNVLDAAIAAAVDLEDLTAIDVDAGWPA